MKATVKSDLPNGLGSVSQTRRLRVLSENEEVCHCGGKFKSIVGEGLEGATAGFFKCKYGSLKVKFSEARA